MDFSQLLQSGELTYGALFVALLVYVIKTNDTREKRYQETIDKNQELLNTAVSALNGYEEVKEEVTKIANKLEV